ncbi:hypothetical protein CBM2599_B51098 [Cupriavidus taiwanensis]|nr:hypothetical protein CBM2599_B51098 [Cupriavidus taiwanensis]SOZ00082.1 hypothetical protein CBM2600_B70108 [Cupriavidus taiwanensis]
MPGNLGITRTQIGVEPDRMLSDNVTHALITFRGWREHGSSTYSGPAGGAPPLHCDARRRQRRHRRQ